MRVYVLNGTAVEGPRELSDLKAELDAGAITDDTQVCPVGEQTWMSLSDALRAASAPGAASPTYSAPQAAPAAGATGPRKSRFSCLGCLGIFVVFVVAILVTAHIVFWHTALPLRFMASMINKSGTFTIGEVSGSLSRGMQVRQVRYEHDDGSVSFIEEAGLSHNRLGEIMKGRRIVLEDLHARRAHIFVSASKEASGGDFDDIQWPTRDDFRSSGTAQHDFDLFAIRSVDIHDFVLEERESGRKLEIHRFLLSDFEVTPDGASIGPIVLESNRLDMQFDPGRSRLSADGHQELELVFNGAFKPELLENASQTVSFGGRMVMAGDEGQGLLDLKAYGERLTLELRQTDEDHTTFMLALRDLNLQAHHADLLIHVHDVKVDLVSDLDDAVHGTLKAGAFSLGQTRFVIEEQTWKHDRDDEMEVMLAATASDPACRIEWRIDVSDRGGIVPRSRLYLISDSETDTRALLSQVLFGAAPGALDASGQTLLERHLEFFDITTSEVAE